MRYIAFCFFGGGDIPQLIGRDRPPYVRVLPMSRAHLSKRILVRAFLHLNLTLRSYHAAIHRCDAPLDFGDLAFYFSDIREQLKLNLHIGV